MDFDRPWRWDFPVFAMTAAKLNKPETAIDMLYFKTNTIPMTLPAIIPGFIFLQMAAYFQQSQ